jgi:DNA-binding beta-propeller fold protein YncE
VTDTLLDTVVKLSPDLRPVAQWGVPDKAGSQPGRFRGPEGIAVDRSGTIYVVDSGNNRVQELSATGRVLRYGPYGLEVDRRGRVFVADKGDDIVQILAPEGEQTGQIG